jgi:hypothetical protein
MASAIDRIVDKATANSLATLLAERRQCENLLPEIRQQCDYYEFAAINLLIFIK